jgi:chemotaxis protein histidine kinase CheA
VKKQIKSFIFFQKSDNSILNKIKKPNWIQSYSNVNSIELETNQPINEKEEQEADQPIDEKEEEELKYNEEPEEKPLMPSESETSEDTHGGSEITESIETSPPRKSTAKKTSQEEESQEEVSQEEESKEKESQEKESQEEESQEEESQEKESQEEESKEKESQEEESQEEESQEKESKEKESQEEESQEKESKEKESQEEESQEKESQEEESQEKESQEEESQEEESQEEESQEEPKNIGKQIKVSYVIPKELQNATDLSNQIVKLFYQVLNRMINSQWLPKERGFSRISMNRAMKRTIHKQAPSYAYSLLSIDKIKLVLDNSGSCQEYAEYLAEIGKGLMKWNNLELYYNGNFELHRGTKYNRKTKKMDQINPMVEIYSQTNIPIIFVGDIDGMANLVQFSRMNPKLLWINLEQREDYEDNPSSHSWVRRYEYADFKGYMIKAPTKKILPQQLTQLLRTMQI